MTSLRVLSRAATYAKLRHVTGSLPGKQRGPGPRGIATGESHMVAMEGAGRTFGSSLEVDNRDYATYNVNPII